MTESTTKDSLSYVIEQLEQLHAERAHQYDSTQFSYIEALVRRAQQQRATVSSLISQRAQIAVDLYRVKFVAARELAAFELAHSLQQYPQVAEQLQQRFDDCDFAGLRRLVAKHKVTKVGESVADLAAYVADSKPATLDQALTFDDMLRQAEHTLIKTVPHLHASTPTAGTNPDSDELSSIHYFRESLVRRNADKLVTQAIKEIPEGAGPLNAQKLIVQSLASMRDLSPHYLNRFVAYIDTLLWLEQAGDN